LRTFAFIAAAVAIMTTSAPAAYLSGAKGTVLVNDRPAPANAEVAAGDRVKPLTSPVNIVCNNRVVATVQPGETAVVLCASSASYTQAPAGSSGSGSPDAILFANGISTNAVMAAGALAAGGATAVILLSGNSDSKPSSP
jgi:hypothetical protein